MNIERLRIQGRKFRFFIFENIIKPVKFIFLYNQSMFYHIETQI